MITIYIVQDEFGYRGGTYFFLQKDKMLRPVPKVSFENIPLEETGRGWRVAYGLKCNEDDKIFRFSFSANPNNRYFSLELNLAKDFPKVKPQNPQQLLDWGWPGPKPRESFYDEHEIASKYLNKFDLLPEMKTKAKEFKKIRDSVKDFVASFSGASKFISAGVSIEQALISPDVFLTSVFAEQEGGLKAISNIVKYLKQIYEIKALVSGLDGKVVKGEISRKGKFYPKEDIQKFSYDFWDHLQLCFGEPNFLLETRDGYYSVWLEFSFTRYCRPDLLILKGRHDTPFENGVYHYLSAQGEDFEKKVLGPWRKRFTEAFTGGKTKKKTKKEGFSQTELLKFLQGLSSYLKKGAIVESKEESFEVSNIDRLQQQLDLYSKVFKNQNLFLLSWFPIPLDIKKKFKDFEIIERFNLGINAAKQFAESIKRKIG